MEEFTETDVREMAQIVEHVEDGARTLADRDARLVKVVRVDLSSDRKSEWAAAEQGLAI
jgi:hypothetical protein